ncbi:cytochrome P450 9e2 isoform X2 [Cryptotermes secundus]|uniref:cytochrome P450 9e2 isoform X2 n=1 Tax=Cryptotermes secundus TaxID=105785 RepID=UPI000CD7D2DA|nr:cytochrome P450 9e2 isoform X2 [Cryptotermes secundus]
MLESLWVWTLATGLISIIGYLLGTWTHDHFSKKNVPHLKPVPFFGNMGSVAFRIVSLPESLVDWYNRLKGHKYGGVYEFLNPIILLRDPELIKMVTVKDFEHFVDRGVRISEEVEPLFGKGLFSLKGQRWKDMRSTLSPAFTSSKMKNMFVLITECGKQLTDFLEKCINDKNMTIEGCKIEREGNILAVEMKDLFTRYTNDVIATSAFGISCDSLNHPGNEFYVLGRDFTNFSGIRAMKLFGYMFSPKVMKLLRIKLLPDFVANFFRSLVHGTMSTREEKGIVRPDMIHLLMQAKKGTLQGDDNVTNNSKITKPKWEDDDITAQVALFFLAGFDTASSLLSFASQLLAMHPDIQSRLQDEIDQTLKVDGGNLTYEAVHGMKYLDMVVSETLRIYPPIGILERRCVQTYTLPAEPHYTLNPGDFVYIPVYALHHDPDYFPDPEKFDPERFSDENKGSIKACTYLPFGSGPRNCIGSRFALMEAKIALVQLLSRFNLKVVPKTAIPIKITKGSFNMTIDGGFWIGLEQRVKSETQ